ncbi:MULTISPECIES: TonB-dependent receptor [unclassified Sphingobacterium]|uniref:SusC/RagA family TonB-linked outer membrane protein n=1 Tax=unclassified Sphingobacterium TaxID=2609468 RepID=UPI00104B90A5|nr:MULTISPECIES: TonB-dependent receptor [unclassified Sphingobacterium]MCS3554195.1 TonB-linked SusC/RagA family outer membrane protein [Sphingobacterium sp. JUb21]TCR08028.1 TonB-linked SusC/RagA family outer membrane protein [Sphingobacterium sp. JUb20]
MNYIRNLERCILLILIFSFLPIFSKAKLALKERSEISRPHSIGRLASTHQQNLEIIGSITDSLGNPIVGASVQVKNQPKIGTATDQNGKYLIEVPSGATLIFKSIGFVTKEITNVTSNRLDVVMIEDRLGLEEAVVVGFGKQKKESVVSSISSVKGESLRFPTRSLSNSLAGQVSGLIAIQRKGEPGYDNSEFWIRGVSTFAGGRSPLVLVDGVPRAMNDIEPDEIETFTVLKDAAATAVYGAEGANGVVIITSKRGTVQKPVISFRTEHSIASPTRLPEFVSSSQYLRMYNEALKNDGEAPVFSDELIANYDNNIDPDLYPNVNWLDVMLRDHTASQRYTLNARGGAERAKYFVSGAYFSENGMFVDDPKNRYNNNIGVERFNLRSNIDLAISNTTSVGVDLSGQYLMTNYPGVSTANIFRQMLLTPAYVFPHIYSDGTLSTFPKERDGNMRNPYNQLVNSGYSREYRSSIQSNISLNQKLNFITEGLLFKTNVSYDYNGNYYFNRAYNPSRYYATGREDNGALKLERTYFGSEDLADPTITSNSDKKIYIESSFNYNRTFGAHTVGGLLLYMQKETQLNNQPLVYRKQGYVGRFTYAFDNRYFIEGNFGYTGSEAFADGYRYGFFPAIGAGYHLSNERFFPDFLKNTISSLKLRGSYGRTGNDNTGTDRFLYRPTFTTDASGFNQGITSGGGSNGLGGGIIEGRFEAPYLGWEIEDKMNLGIDLSLFNGKINVVADYFNNERFNILLQRRTTLQSSGYRQSPWMNYGRVNNKGFDASIDAHHKIGDVKISTRGTFTFARNKILEYDELPQPYDWMNVTGTRVGENQVYIAERLYEESDFDVTLNNEGRKQYTIKTGIPVSTLGGNIGPGDIMYKDLNNDGVIDNFDVKRGEGDPYNPEIVYGFGLNVEYKGFYMSAFFQGVANTSVILGNNTPEGWFPFYWAVDQGNLRSFTMDRWTEENPSQDVMMPKLHRHRTLASNNYVASTWWMRSGNFLRFKNFEFGYNFNEKFLEKLKIKKTRLYVMGHNLAVWDSIKFWDPETGNESGGLSYPMPKSITFGLEASF